MSTGIDSKGQGAGRVYESFEVFETTETIHLDLLCELGRATTAFHDATPDRFEIARREYEEALRKYKAMLARQ